MDIQKTKTRRIFADFSIEALLRKDDSGGRESKRQTWGTVQQPNIFPFTAHPGYNGESVTRKEFGHSPTIFPNQEESELCKESLVKEEEEEFISVSDDNEADDVNCKSRNCGNGDDEDVSDERTFEWLTCTRFKPPKLPRPRKKSTSRRSGRGPRIPFSTHQLAVLENTFANSQYLSSDAIGRLAQTLNLTETRVKIWLQNRRARYRREKDSFRPLNFKDHSLSSSLLAKSEKAIGHFPSLQHGTCPASINLSSKQSFRHLINDLNLMAATAPVTSIASSIHGHNYKIVENRNAQLVSCQDLGG